MHEKSKRGNVWRVVHKKCKMEFKEMEREMDLVLLCKSAENCVNSD